MTKLDLIRSSIKSIPDYPKAGIIFRDITSLLEVPEAFQATIDATAKLIRRLGGKVEHAAFVIWLPDLGGKERLEKEGIQSFTLVEFAGH